MSSTESEWPEPAASEPDVSESATAQHDRVENDELTRPDDAVLDDAVVPGDDAQPAQPEESAPTDVLQPVAAAEDAPEVAEVGRDSETSAASDQDASDRDDVDRSDADQPAELDPGAIEAILLVTDEPLQASAIAEVLQQPVDRITAALQRLAADYTEQSRGFELREVASGWRLYTREKYAATVERFVLEGQQTKLTQAALETLAVVAYRQPVSRARVSAIRGVNCDGVMKTLVTRGLVTEKGADQETGATLFGTTGYFLERLGLGSLEELPDLAPYLPEIDEMEELAHGMHGRGEFGSAASAGSAGSAGSADEHSASDEETVEPAPEQDTVGQDTAAQGPEPEMLEQDSAADDVQDGPSGASADFLTDQDHHQDTEAARASDGGTDQAEVWP